MPKGSGLLLAVWLVVISATFAAADTLTLKADYWMPFNGDGKTETGYMLDIARAVFEPLGHKVVYVMTPWEKAIAECRSGKCSAIIGASTDDAPDLVYPVEDQGVSQQLFCIKAGSPWRFAGVASLKPIKLGIIKDYAYFKELDDYLKTNPPGIVFGTGENPLQANITKLVQGELGAVVDDRSVLKYTIAKMGLQGKVVIAAADASSAQSSSLYIAFSPANPKSAEYSRALSEGMASLRKSGQLKKILAKYGLTDWK